MNDLLKVWGKLSAYLHWSGAYNETTAKADWVDKAHLELESVITPIWEKLCSGQSGLLHPDDMKPEVRAIWEDFRSGTIDANSVRVRLQLIQPLLRQRTGRSFWTRT